MSQFVGRRHLIGRRQLLQLGAASGVISSIRPRRISVAAGTTDFVFDPVDFLGRLAVLVPRPRINLLLYLLRPGRRARWPAQRDGEQAGR